MMALSLLLAGSGAVGPAAAEEALSARVRGILTAHCVDCHDGTGAEIDLAAIVRDPNLVRPGNPDGSPAYTSLVRRIGTTSQSASADDLGTLRGWIASLPAAAATCATGSFPPRVRMEVELARIATAARKPISEFRVLSLNHLDLGCATASRLAAWRQTLGLVLAAAAGKTNAARTHLLGADARHFAINIQDLGWSAERWRTLIGASPDKLRPDEPLFVRADQLVARVLRDANGNLGPALSDTDRQRARALLAPIAAPDSLERHAAIMLHLARRHLDPVGIAQVAAELGVRPQELMQSIEPVAKVAPDPWLRLTFGTVPRAEIEHNWTLIARSAGLKPPAHAEEPARADNARRATATADSPIDVIMYPDRPRYIAGDAMQLTFRSNADCALTVVSIDSGGYGTVIFPNDFVTSNRIRAHVDMTLPAKGARYRFRLKSKGRERVVALCTRAEGSVDGIQHNFERQRFQEIGSYADFLNAALKRTESPVDEKPDNDGMAVVPQSAIWRTGIVIDVK